MVWILKVPFVFAVHVVACYSSPQQYYAPPTPHTAVVAVAAGDGGEPRARPTSAGCDGECGVYTICDFGDWVEDV